MEQLPFYPSFFNSTTEPAIRLAERLAALAPSALNHTFFSNSGSEANETALKLIRAYCKLRGQPARRRSSRANLAYHGVTLATTSMTGLPSCNVPFDLPLPGFIHVPGPHAYAAKQEDDPLAYGQLVPGGNGAHHSARRPGDDRRDFCRTGAGRGRRDRAADRLPRRACAISRESTISSSSPMKSSPVLAASAIGSPASSGSSNRIS